MVVEILEEKLDREYCDNAARLMMQDDGKASVEEDMDDRTTRISKEEHIFPQGWEPMSLSEVVDGIFTLFERGKNFPYDLWKEFEDTKFRNDGSSVF